MNRGNLSTPTPSFVKKPVVFDIPQILRNSSSTVRGWVPPHQSVRAGAEDANRPRIRSIG